MSHLKGIAAKFTLVQGSVASTRIHFEISHGKSNSQCKTAFPYCHKYFTVLDAQDGYD